ncbi:immunoglobulin-like domain-containing protein [Clostridium perfringens]|uniref:immunoglobulin-like domain-containing protein n=1 Tax=Clostridium perfringens TaxID=1502 RepID=UPI0024BC9DDD|nr:immunoglobulin-like domain-containing protein [Clostridium perfringens]
MKKLLTIILSFLLLSIPQVTFANPTSNSNIINNENDIIIPDINLKKAINEILGQPVNSKISKAQLESLKNLNLENKNIKNIEGINYCINLKSLNLIKNNISDITPLSNLNNLTILRLNNNKISDINSLTNLTNLTNLDLGINNISNISPLNNLKKLTILELGLNKISNIETLSNLTNLKTLRMMNNNISDISSISNLNNLTTLNLSSNKISDISSLINLKNLKTLRLENNNISNISIISNLTKLNIVNITNQIISLGEKQAVNGSLKINNNIIGLDKNLVAPISISNNGLYKNDFITWKIDANTNLSWNFNKTYTSPCSIPYSGTVSLIALFKENVKPMITGADNISIIEGSNFNPLEGVIAEDKEDGNLTKDIKVNGTVDTNKVGKYILTYSVTDSNGNTTTVERTITVNPKPSIINNAPVINAANQSILQGSKFNPLEGVTAEDKEDGNLTDDIKVIKNTVDTSKIGKYTVTYEVTDNQGASTTKTITVTVLSNTKPIISDVDSISIVEGSNFNPLEGVIAEDKEDGNLTKDIKVNGTVDTNKVGKYILTYSVTDSNGNTTTVERTITVNPKPSIINNAPVINAANQSILQGSKFNPLEGVTAEDKEDGNLTDDIKVIKNTVDTSKIGKYTVTYEVTDNQGASTTKTITVTILNNSHTGTLPNTGDPTTLPYLGLLVTCLGLLIIKIK